MTREVRVTTPVVDELRSIQVAVQRAQQISANAERKNMALHIS